MTIKKESAIVFPAKQQMEQDQELEKIKVTLRLNLSMILMANCIL